ALGCVVAAGRLPGADDDDREKRDRRQHAEHDERLEASAPPLRPSGRAPCPQVAIVRDESGVELVDVKLSVEAEVVGVRAEEALDVRLRRQKLEALLLERAEVLRADLRRLLGLDELHPAPDARFPKTVSDLEQAREA